MSDHDHDLVAFLERTLTQARAGRVLFVVASIGVVGGDARKPSLEGLDVRKLLAGPAAAPGAPAHTLSAEELRARFAARAAAAGDPGPGFLAAPAATQAPTRTFWVEVGAFVGAFAEGLGPHELASAMQDCVSGVRYAEAGLAAEVADRVEAKLPAKEKRS